MYEIIEEAVDKIIMNYAETVSESIVKEMWECEDSYIVRMGNHFEPNELWVLGSIINGHDSGWEFDVIKNDLDERIQTRIKALPEKICELIYAWNEEYENDYYLNFTEMVYDKICKAADEDWMLPYEWGKDKYVCEYKNSIKCEIEFWLKKGIFNDDRTLFICKIIEAVTNQFKEWSKYSVEVLKLIVPQECDKYLDEVKVITKDEIFNALLGYTIDDFLEEYSFDS